MTDAPLKSLVAMAAERLLLRASGKQFVDATKIMRAAGLAPERISVLMTEAGQFHLQFNSPCDIRPFTANYSTFSRLLRGLIHLSTWKIKSLEFVCVDFRRRDVPLLERAINKLSIELVVLKNCHYSGICRGEESIRFIKALNREKKTIVCEYGDDRLKDRIREQSAKIRAKQIPVAEVDA